MNELLRQITSLTPGQVTSEVAPTLGAGTDVAAEPTRVIDLTMPTPRTGTCLHDGHIDYQGTRLGVLVVDDYHASHRPCLLVNEDGR